jgi:uncharacterized protein YcbX
VRVSGLWRYPVKSLGGEALESAELTLDGVAGDRLELVSGRRADDARGSPLVRHLSASTGSVDAASSRRSTQVPATRTWMCSVESTPCSVESWRSIRGSPEGARRGT